MSLPMMPSPESNMATAELLKAVELLRSHLVDKTESKNGVEETSKSGADASVARLVERHFALLHSKMDKLIRLQDTCNTQQKQILASLNALSKRKVPNEDDEKQHTDKTGVFEKTSSNKALAVLTPSLSSSLSSALSTTPAAPPHWAQNMFLLGDAHVEALTHFEGSKMNLLRQEVGLKVSHKRHLTLDRVYDERRAKLLEALPVNTRSVVLSVGAVDLMLDCNLVTLEKANLDTVKAHNLPVLKAKVQHLMKAVKAFQSTVSTEKRLVVLVLPAHGEERIEVFRHWEQLVQEEVRNMPKIRIVNLAKCMRESMRQFSSHEDYLSHWLGSNREKKRVQLSAQGATKLLELIEDAVRVAESENDQCLRCLKQHPGGDSACRSKNKACRVCGRVGHFGTLHSITDAETRNRITRFLAEDIFTSAVSANSSAQVASSSAKRQFSESNGDDEESKQKVEESTSKKAKFHEEFSVPEGNKDEDLNGWYER